MQLELMRRQLTLFLPPEASAMVEPVRQRLDPRQHACIGAHVTLCRDRELAPWPIIQERLKQLRDTTVSLSVTMSFGPPQVLPDGCVLMRPTHGEAEYRALRHHVLGPTAPKHGAHLTLLHPRHAVGVRYDLEALSQALTGLRVRFRTIALIAEGSTGVWRLQREYRLSG